MRVALEYETFASQASLERERVMLARALVRRGVEVHVYAARDGFRTSVDGIVEHSVPAPASRRSRVREGIEYGRYAWAATRELRRDRARYDVVDVLGTTAWEHDVVRVHAVPAAEQRRWPERGGRHYRAARIRSFVAPAVHLKVGVAAAVERLQFRSGRFKVALAVTEDVRRDLQELYRVPDEAIEVVPYPVDLEAVRSAEPRGLRMELGLRDGEPLALFVGHDFERKGLDTAIAAVAGVERLHLVVVGGGNAAPYAAAARAAGIADRVHFVGPTDEPERAFRDCDVFLLPTREDVWGTSVIEALAAAVPVVATSVAGASRVVRESGGGIVVGDGDVRAIRDALRSVLDDSRRRELGARGRAAADAYGVDAFAERVLGAYERVRTHV